MAEGIIHLVPGNIKDEYQRFLQKGIKANLLPQIMTRHAEVYSTKSDLQKLIGNRLGWVDVATAMKKQVPAIERFAEKCFDDGLCHVILMGMGGSSLAPEVFKLTFGIHKRLESFDVLDSTDPSAVTAVARNVALERTLFIVASKSGGTVETRSHEAYFIGRLRSLYGRPVKAHGKHFAVITDEGSELQKFAVANKYRKVFVNPSDIGGRYSALSLFGLVPAYFAGIDLRALLDDALMMQELLAEREDESNPGLALGAFMSAAWKAGRDKLTFIASRKTTPFVPWIEQLIAESTGKKGKGIVPIEGEPLLKETAYKDDRCFVFLRMAGERQSELSGFQRALMKDRIPVAEITLGSPIELGRQFLLWEAATAATGWYLGINPFDEPNVTESKENTKKILKKFERVKQLPLKRAATAQDLTLIATDQGKGTQNGDDIESQLRLFFSQAKPPKYIAILNYVKSEKRVESTLAELRKLIGNSTGCATLRGYGPRFLHSIGQLYKGGAENGMFIVFLRGDYGSVGIPGQKFDFGQLITAQAIGDSQALMKRNLPTLMFEIDGSPAAGLEHFYRLVRKVVER